MENKRKEYLKKYYEANKDKVKCLSKNYVESNKEKTKAYQKEYREVNKEKLKEGKQNYYNDNKEKLKEYQKHYQKEYLEVRKNKKLADPLYKLESNIRVVISKSLKNNGYKKLSQTELILGCTYENFKLYLESKFEIWQNWGNYGNWNGTPTEPQTAWDIDHIIPLSSATNETELLKLNHYTNLQPLCSYYNRYVKKDKF